MLFTSVSGMHCEAEETPVDKHKMSHCFSLDEWGWTFYECKREMDHPFFHCRMMYLWSSIEVEDWFYVQVAGRPRLYEKWNPFPYTAVLFWLWCSIYWFEIKKLCAWILAHCSQIVVSNGLDSWLLLIVAALASLEKFPLATTRHFSWRLSNSRTGSGTIRFCLLSSFLMQSKALTRTNGCCIGITWKLPLVHFSHWLV